MTTNPPRPLRAPSRAAWTASSSASRSSRSIGGEGSGHVLGGLVSSSKTAGAWGGASSCSCAAGVMVSEDRLPPASRVGPIRCPICGPLPANPGARIRKPRGDTPARRAQRWAMIGGDGRPSIKPSPTRCSCQAGTCRARLRPAAAVRAEDGCQFASVTATRAATDERRRPRGSLRSRVLGKRRPVVTNFRPRST